MKMFLLNLLLAIMWMLFWGWASIYTLVAGFVLGYLLLGLISRVIDERNYATRGLGVLQFAAYFMRIMIKANLQVAWEVITPGHKMSPRIIRYGVSDLTDVQLTTLANSISLTPGTLSMDVSEDRRYLYIHAMYAKDRAAAVRDLDELKDHLMRLVF